MNKIQFPFTFDGEDIKFCIGKTTKDVFDTVYKMQFTEKTFNVPDKLGVIGVSKDIYDLLMHQKLVLINKTTNSYVNVCLKARDDVKNNQFISTPHVKETLNLQSDSEIYLCKYKEYNFKNVRVQKIDHIRESDLVISRIDSLGIFCDINKSPYDFFEIYNSFSNESIIVKKSHIIIDDDLEAGSIRLSRKQRICLGLELPQSLTNEQWDYINKNLDHASDDYKTIQKSYANNHVLDKSISYDEKLKAKKIFAKCFGSDTKIIPVIESAYNKRKSILQRICDFYVGKSTISLICHRPYDIDEGIDIVRISKSNMRLLGIDEMDKVTLQYKNRKISCRVLELDDVDAFLETNLAISPDLVIGIPAHIRKKLNILDLSSSIKIDRDTKFIFKKSINEQIVPVLLTLFSTNLFTDWSIIQSAILSAIAIPVVLFFNLSSKRNMRS